jgi:hypothetical protein
MLKRDGQAGVLFKSGLLKVFALDGVNHGDSALMSIFGQFG